MLNDRVETMKLAEDKKSLFDIDSLTLAGIPPEIFDYRLGNRSALEWVIDQYRVKEDKRSAIRSDPNNPDDPEYIVRLVGQVVRVSVETVKIVAALPKRFAPHPEPWTPNLETQRRSAHAGPDSTIQRFNDSTPPASLGAPQRPLRLPSPLDP